MSEPPQLLLRLLAVGDVLVGPGDAANGAVEIVHRSGGDPDVDQRAVLAQAPQLHVSNGLAFEGAVEQSLRYRLLATRYDLGSLAEHLLGRIAEYLLGPSAPEHEIPAGFRADDRHRRCVDHGRQRVLGLAQFVGSAAGFILASLERDRHVIEIVRERSNLVVGANRAAVAELAGRERGGVLAELPQRPDDAARKHPGDGEGRDQRADDEQRAPAEPRYDGGEGNVLRQSDRHQPRDGVRDRGAGDAFDAIRPGDNLAHPLGRDVACDFLRLADVAADPIRAIGGPRNDDPVLTDHLDDASGRQVLHPEGVLKMIQVRAGHQDGLHFA